MDQVKEGCGRKGMHSEGTDTDRERRDRGLWCPGNRLPKKSTGLSAMLLKGQERSQETPPVSGDKGVRALSGTQWGGVRTWEVGVDG